MALTTGEIVPSENSQTFTHLTGSEMVKTIEMRLPSITSACVYNVKVVSSVGEVLFNHTFYGNSKPCKDLNEIDWEKLRDEFFNDCASKHVNIEIDIAPHDLFNWFKNKIQTKEK